MKNYIFIAVIVLIVSAGFVYVTADAKSYSSVDTLKPIYRACGDVCTEVYSEVGTGVIRTRVFDSDSVVLGLVVSDVLATDEQIFNYALLVQEYARANAESALNSDIEIGKNWVSVLREWSADELAAADSWAGWSTSQKLNAMEVKMRRDSKMKNGLADLLVTLGY